MHHYLVFRLYGPMASWGAPAVGGDRPTGIVPSRSAILGLLGAALGIKRQDQETLDQLHNSFTIAVKQKVAGSLLRDFHTIQVPSTEKGVTHLTRKRELTPNKKSLNTILSSRDYHCDGLWVVALSATDSAEFSFECIKKALLKPVYSLSLGRKSCPPALPLSPQIVASPTLKEALDTPFPPIMASEKQDHLWLNHDGWVTYVWEGERAQIAGDNILTTHPWDDPLHRTRWQFRQRTQHQLSVEENTEKRPSHVSI